MTRALVVDDSATDRRLAGGLLQKADFEVFYAANGREATEAFELHVPDVVVTDIQMPEMNGLEFVRAVKEKYPRVPVVLMTSKGSEEIAVEALESGAASYVPKRLLAEDLVETVQRVVDTSSEHGTLHRVTNRMTEIAFSIENDLKLLAGLAGQLRQIVENRLLLDRTECLRIGTAIDEALQNAYYHGNLEVSSQLRENDDRAYYDLANQRLREEPYASRRIHVRATFDADSVTITVRDDGPGFDPETVPDPTDPRQLERASGRGLLLMRTFMDEVAFNAAGNQVTMVKRHVEDDEDTEVDDDDPATSIHD